MTLQEESVDSEDQNQNAQNVQSDTESTLSTFPFSIISQLFLLISCFPVGYREISVKIFFYLTLVPPVKIPIFTFLLPRLIARASQPDGNMTSFTLHFSRLT